MPMSQCQGSLHLLIQMILMGSLLQGSFFKVSKIGSLKKASEKGILSWDPF